MPCLGTSTSASPTSGFLQAAKPALPTYVPTTSQLLAQIESLCTNLYYRVTATTSMVTYFQTRYRNVIHLILRK
jgi:hypothetical protein